MSAAGTDPPDPAGSIHAHVDRARRRLERAGIGRDEASLDARLLAQSVLGWDQLRFVTSSREPWPSEPPDPGSRYDALIDRRVQREPLAYITGEREFWNLTFEVSPAVLIPRPETELIVEAALDQRPSKDAPLLVADVCTGSGCLAISLAREYAGAKVTATDISRDALGMARRNAVRHGVQDRIDFVEDDLITAPSTLFELMVCNPPYVAERDRASLQPEVRDHEPAIALFAGDDGMHVIRRLVTMAPSRLAIGGVLLFEFGFGQALAVEELISSTSGLTMVAVRKDLQGIARTAVVRRT